MYKIKTPDGEYFIISLIPKAEADSLEKEFSGNRLDDSLLPLNKKSAYRINDGKILYRQFYQGTGFVFPDINDYSRAVRGKTYYSVSIQPSDDKNGSILAFDQYTRIAVLFSLWPVSAHAIKQNIASEITGYASYDGNRFYLLKDSSVVELRDRTATLASGEWFSSMQDFDYFYYTLSGQGRPVISI
jgi:hypothetical protein